MISVPCQVGLMMSLFGLAAADTLSLSASPASAGLRFERTDRGGTVSALPYRSRLWEKIWCPDLTASRTSSDDPAFSGGNSPAAASLQDRSRTGRNSVPRSALAAADFPPPPGMNDQMGADRDRLWPETGRPDEPPSSLHRTSSAELPGAAGPSATTLLVGLAALIVCTGALFGGRQ